MVKWYSTSVGGTTAVTNWCWRAAIQPPFTGMLRCRSSSSEIFSLRYLVPSQMAGPRVEKRSGLALKSEVWIGGSSRRICAYGATDQGAALWLVTVCVMPMA